MINVLLYCSINVVNRDIPILAITQREDTNDGAQQSANAHPNNAKKNEKKDKASPKADRILLSQQRNSSAPKKSSSKAYDN